MRSRDTIKQAALFEATVKLVNEIGFASSSVSKIAKEAQISPATLYIYHKNKEDLLVSTYVRIKRDMGRTILEDFDDKLPVRDIFRIVWFNIFEYVSVHPAYFQYAEQFSNSPYSSLVDKQEIEQYFAPLIQVVTRGTELKIIKDVELDILTAFLFHPIMALANPRLCRNFKMNKKNIETAFCLAWDAIRL